MIRVGIIGTGKHGTRYANHIIQDFPDVLKLTAISRRSQEGITQAARFGATYFAEWRHLVLDRSVDAVIAATTPNLNLEIAKTCASLGKPLLMEKPLAIDVQQAEQIVEACAGSGTPLTVAQTLRYNTIIQSLRNNLTLAGRLNFFSASHRLEPSSLSWLEDPAVAGGGVILHTAIHMFDAIRFITGKEIVKVRASGHHLYNKNLEDLFVAEIEMDSGLAGCVDASKISPARSGRYEFLGDKGLLQGDQIHNTLEFLKGMSATTLPVPGPSATIKLLLHDWQQFLSGACPNPIPGAEGLQLVRICDACRESIRKNSWVRLS